MEASLPVNSYPLTDNSQRWFFSDASALARFNAAWPKWLKTPFRDNSCAPGPTGGVYCVALCEAILAESEAIRPCSFPHNKADYHPHRASSRILEYLRGEAPNETSAYLHERFAELPIADGNPTVPLMHGDLFLGSFDGFFHLPLITDPETGQFVHAIKPFVGEGRIFGDSTYEGRAIAHFRARAI